MRTQSTFYIGIDPGLDGAVAVLDSKGRLFGVWDTPTLSVKSSGKTRREYSTALMVNILRAALNCNPRAGAQRFVAGLEQVHAMPQQGVSSMFSMGEGYGIWKGIIAALEIPLYHVRPQVWKKRLMEGRGKDKAASILAAQERVPSSVQFLTKKKDHGRADAILIAEFVRTL